MKRLLSLLLILAMCVSLYVACTSQNIDKIQEMMIDDEFVIFRPSSTYHEYNGFESKSSSLNKLLFYDDGTFASLTLKQRRTYKDGVLYRSEYNHNNYDEREELHGTFELKQKIGEIIVVLNITTRNYKKYDGSTKEVENDEQYNEVKEYSLIMKNNSIVSIGPYESLKYVNQKIIDDFNQSINQSNIFSSKRTF